MPNYDLNRSIDIDAPLESVRELITDFRRWPAWSPWTIQEPECTLDFFGDTGAVGSGYSWAGNRIGAGEMTLRHSDTAVIDCDLQFLKPFKSQADVRFDLASLGENRCRITWHMHSSMPFFLFFMIPSIKQFVGLDYERGLRMLKELAETGGVACEITIQGDHTLPACHYLGTEITASLADLPALMETHYGQLAQHIELHSLDAAGPPFAQYLKVNFKRDSHRIVLGIPISGTLDTSLNGYHTGSRPQMHCVRFDHTGGYEHLGNTWATGIGWVRHNKRKTDKRAVGIEVYVTDPATTARDALITELYIPVKP